MSAQSRPTVQATEPDQAASGQAAADQAKAERRTARQAANLARLARMPLASVYPHYVAKAEKKGRTRAEVDEVIRWLTGFDQEQLQQHLAAETSFGVVFEQATLNPNASLITGVVCGVRVEDIEDSFMQRLRYLDKLIDELAKGKSMEKILRT